MGRSMGGARGGGRSGGSRSGGGRSSAGRSMGGSRSGTSRAFGSGHSGGSAVRGSGRSYSGQTSSGNPLMGGGYNNHSGSHYGGSGYHHDHYSHDYHHHHHYGYGYRRHYYNNGYYGRRSGGGCSSVFAVLILFIILVSFAASTSMYRRNNSMYYNYNAPSYKDSYSNVERTKFAGKVNLNGYYSDPDGLLRNDEIAPIEKGLKHFYKTTGVCAYVYFVEELDENVDGNEMASQLYDELFNDEGHILLLYDYMNAYMYDAEGYEIGTVIDSEALDILYDYIEAQWSQDSENLGAIFGNGCAMAADRIMFKQRTFAQKYKSIIIVVIVGIVAIIVINVAFKWWKAKTAQKNKEQEDLERTLKTPLETFGDSPVDDLAKKYDDDPNNDPE